MVGWDARRSSNGLRAATATATARRTRRGSVGHLAIVAAAVMVAAVVPAIPASGHGGMLGAHHPHVRADVWGEMQDGTAFKRARVDATTSSEVTNARYKAGEVTPDAEKWTEPRFPKVDVEVRTDGRTVEFVWEQTAHLAQLLNCEQGMIPTTRNCDWRGHVETKCRGGAARGRVG